MEFVKKFQYSIVLFLICITIFTSGFLPNATKLLHRTLIAPEEYIQTFGVITEMVAFTTSYGQPSYEVYVTYQPEEGRTEVTAKLEDYVEGMEEGMEIQMIYHQLNPEYIMQDWGQWSKVLLHGSFTVVSLLVGIMMMRPASVPFEHRTPKTLRQRLEQYK